jgi:hypothetical protein
VSNVWGAVPGHAGVKEVISSKECNKECNVYGAGPRRGPV